MSIFASLASPDADDHLDSCAQWVIRDDTWSVGDRPCDCGQPDAPIVYQGSHVLPSEGDPRGGSVDLALIPGHVRPTRDGREYDDNAPPEPFLRFGVNSETVILTRANVEQVHASLTEWLELTA